MEHISSFKLKEYDDILKNIENEHLKHSELEEQIQLIDDRIIATGLTLKKNLIKEKIFKVLVKPFDSIFGIYDKIPDKNLQNEIELLLHSRENFYLVEVNISKPFQEKLIRNNWIINAALRNNAKCISKSMNLNRKATNPIRLIVPFENSIEPAMIEIYLTWPGKQVWPILKIANYPINISYHFNLNSEIKIKRRFHTKVINLSKLYNSKSISAKLPVIKSKLMCSMDLESFLQTLLKNSYHNWDPRKDSCFSKTEYIAYAKTATGLGNTITIELDTSASTLILSGNPYEVFHLKTYFIAEFAQETYEIRRGLDKNTKVLLDSFESDSRNIDVLAHIYEEINKVDI